MSSCDSLQDLGSCLQVGKNADQAESQAIKCTTTSIGDSLLDERMSGEFDDARGDDFIEGTNRAEELLSGQTLEQLERRRSLLDTAWPFKLNGQRLEYIGQKPGVYEFCLNLSTEVHDKGKTSGELVLFERIVSRLIGYFIGGYDIRTGWPSHDPTERPKNFKDLAELISKKTHEWKWLPDNEDDDTGGSAKDGGMDFLAWRPLDARSGHLFIIGQCACGEDWRNKYRDLDMDRLKRWWPNPSYVPPLRAFAIPRVIPGVRPIAELSRETGLLFDRIRLALVREHLSDIDAKTFDRWFQDELNRLKTKDQVVR